VDGADAAQEWRVGAVASATGLTVCALRHYDEIGLVVPSSRSSAGHRRYTGSDLRRLHIVVALRSLGLPLADVAGVLDNFLTDPRPLIRRQLRQLEERVAIASRLRRRLYALLGALDEAAEPSARTIIDVIEEITAMDDKLTSQELDQLTEGRQRMTARLPADQLAELTERRRTAMAQLTSDERAAMARQRSQSMAGPDSAHPDDESRS
jgi:DNA-binding transcriptional MerR regulator